MDTLWVVALLFNSPDKRNCWPEKIWRVIHLLLNDSLVCTASADQIIIICYFLDQLRRRSAALQNGGWNVNTKQYFKLSFGRARSYIILKFPPFQLPWTPWGSWGLPASSARPQPSPQNRAGRQKVRGSQTRPADQWGPWIGDTVRWSCFFFNVNLDKSISYAIFLFPNQVENKYNASEYCKIDEKHVNISDASTFMITKRLTHWCRRSLRQYQQSRLQLWSECGWCGLNISNHMRIQLCKSGKKN